MKLQEEKYRNLFVKEFSANEIQYDNEFKRIIKENSDSDDLRLRFYHAVFEKLINQIKTEFSENENYRYFINTRYNLFITALKGDNIDTTKLDNELEELNSEISKNNHSKKNNFVYQPDNKIYNLNTKYGRKKAREQAQRNYINGTPEYRQEIDNMKAIAWTIIIIIAVIIYLIKNI